MNVLWILTTQWRAQSCGYFGREHVDTPAIDALAKESINFSQAVTPHPFGPFARAALLTGVASPGNGVRDYFDPLPVESRTIAHAFGEIGYATAFFGKWHLAPRDPASPLVGEAHARTIVPPERRGGFEMWEGFESGFQLNDPWLHGTRLPSPVKMPGYQSDVVCGRAGDWMAEAKGRPWFCVVSVEPPHPPYHAAPAARSYDEAKIALSPNVPRGGDVEACARRELAGYYAHISATDRAIGALLGRIDRSNTVVVFTSVHGDMHGAHGLFRKGWPHEESIRVPLLVRRPGVSPSRTEAAVSLLDLSLHTLAWAENKVTTVPETSCAQISMPSVVRLPNQCDRVWRGVRSPHRKLVVNEDGSPWLFFDLENDPYELNNLVGSATHVSEIEEWRRRILR